jgi:hypothetical protein
MSIKVICQPYYTVGSCGDGCCSWSKYRNVYLAANTMQELFDTGWSEFKDELECPADYEVIETLAVIESSDEDEGEF